MPAMPAAFDLLERSQIFQEQLMDIDSLDALISLACSVLDCSLYICDGQGFLLASSPVTERTCAAFRHTAEDTRQVSKEKLRAMLGPSPLCNVVRDPQCEGEACARLSFPLKIGEQGLPGAITFFIWDRQLTTEDQALASMVAGAFAVFMRKRFTSLNTAQARKISLLRELLDYKPGLRTYYESCIALENLHKLSGAFRMLCICPPESHKEHAGTMAMELQRLFENAWVFPHKDNVLIVFSESQLSPDDLCAALSDRLAQFSSAACLSVPFSQLLDLRRTYEDTYAACRIAARKEAQPGIHRAERWMDLVFLHKCRLHFPLEDYYLEGFRRLHDYDDENGRGYLDTLKAYLDCNMSVSAAAKSIFMHRNTMAQQLEKIEELLGVSLKDPHLCWYLQLCLRIHELLAL